MNLIEGLWGWLKSEMINNIFYESVNHICQAVISFIDSINKDLEQVITRYNNSSSSFNLNYTPISLINLLKLNFNPIRKQIKITKKLIIGFIVAVHAGKSRQIRTKIFAKNLVFMYNINIRDIF